MCRDTLITLTISCVAVCREMLAIADSREAINANIEQKVSMFVTYPNPNPNPIPKSNLNPR